MMTFLSKLEASFKRRVRADFHAAQNAIGDKQSQRSLLLERKAEIVKKQNEWVEKHQQLLNEFCRKDLPQKYVPKSLRLMLCTKQWQHDLWRIIKLTHWSMPPNEYVGRRKRILVFDGDHVVGLIGLASCIWGLTARDEWIGWDTEQKAERINYVVDAYVLGAIPPYNGSYRGSKLLAYICASDELREIWRSEYRHSPAAIVTTTLFGHSAVLNRVRHNGSKLWHGLGYTRGIGTMHFSVKTNELAKELLAALDITVPNRLNSGPNWKLRLMRTAVEAVGLRAEDYLQHGYKRGVYLMEYALNTKEFLSCEHARLRLKHHKLENLMESWLAATRKCHSR